MQISDVIERFIEYRLGHCTWGSLHIVLDDGNFQNQHVEFCKRYAIEDGDTEGAELAAMLLLMSTTQRRKLRRRVDELIKERGL